MNGEEVLIEGIACGRVAEVRLKGKTMQRLLVRDETGSCTITWFNQSYLKNKFEAGEKYKFYGKITNNFGKITMTSPVFDEKQKNFNTGKIIPLYPLTYQLSQNVLRKIMEAGLVEVEGKLQETLPMHLLEEYGLEEINEAARQIHFPKELKDFERARKRLVF